MQVKGFPARMKGMEIEDTAPCWPSMKEISMQEHKQQIVYSCAYKTSPKQPEGRVVPGKFMIKYFTCIVQNEAKATTMVN